MLLYIFTQTSMSITTKLFSWETKQSMEIIWTYLYVCTINHLPNNTGSVAPCDIELHFSKPLRGKVKKHWVTHYRAENTRACRPYFPNTIALNMWPSSSTCLHVIHARTDRCCGSHMTTELYLWFHAPSVFPCYMEFILRYWNFIQKHYITKKKNRSETVATSYLTRLVTVYVGEKVSSKRKKLHYLAKILHNYSGNASVFCWLLVFHCE